MGNVFGFRQYPPRALTFAHPFSGVAIAIPALDLLMRQDNGVVTDRTSYGNNGVCSGCVGARGVFDEGQKFNGVNNLVNCGTPAILNITGDISILGWVNQYANAFQAVVYKGNAAANRGWGLLLWVDGTIAMLDSALPGWRLAGVGTPTLPGRYNFVCGTKQGVIFRSFVDGLQVARVDGNAAFNAGPADVCYIGEEPIPRYFIGSIELPQVFSGALSPEQVYRKYLEAKDVPIYYDTFKSYAVTPVAKTIGSMCGPVRVIGNPLLIAVDANGKKWLAGSGAVNCNGGLTLPDNAAYGTLTHKFKRDGANDHYLYWCNNLVTVAATTNGYAIIVTAATMRVYRITGGAAAAVLFNNAYATVAGVEYECRLVRRVGGQVCLYLKGGAYPDFTLVGGPVTDNTHTTAGFLTPWLQVNGSTTDWTLSRVCERPASFPWEFLSGTYGGVVSGSTIWMNCLTAGVTYLPKDLDWLQMTFGIYKGADANVTDLLFMATEIGGTTFANQNGYCLRLAADESVQLIRTSAGIETQLTTTAAGYIAINTEYEIKVTHDWALHMFTFYIRGGAYTDWTSIFSFGLGIYTSSNYTIWDLDASDRATAPTFRSVPR